MSVKLQARKLILVKLFIGSRITIRVANGKVDSFQKTNSRVSALFRSAVMNIISKHLNCKFITSICIIFCNVVFFHMVEHHSWLYFLALFFQCKKTPMFLLSMTLLVITLNPMLGYCCLGVRYYNCYPTVYSTLTLMETFALDGFLIVPALHDQSHFSLWVNLCLFRKQITRNKRCNTYYLNHS